jgi:hypothetical protein
MKAKTIKAILRKKIDGWIATIEDEDVRNLAQSSIIVTGGAIASMLLGEPVNDFDIYFRTWEATAKIAHYYCSRFQPKTRNGIPCRIFLANGSGSEITDMARTPLGTDDGRIKVMIKSAGIASANGAEKPYEYFEAQAEGGAQGYVSELMQNRGDIQDTYENTEAMALETIDDGKLEYRTVFMSSNAITLTNRIQLVIRFWGEPDAIHENYDFVHCTSFWKSWDNELVLRPAALEALLAKELRYIGSKYPLCSIIRLRKFIARGWTINAGQILKAAMQLSELDLKDISVLEDQLTGVDSAYFLEVISKIKEKDPQKVNSAYLIEIIDRMF